MPDFFQNGLITTLHDLRACDREGLETLLRSATTDNRIGLVLPVTAGDMQAGPFSEIIDQLRDADYIDTFIVTLGVAPKVEDYQQTVSIVDRLGAKARVIWTDGPRVQHLYKELIDYGFHLSTPGKGRSVWTAFGYLLKDVGLTAFALHDCDIVGYDREMLARLCLPMVHPSLDFEFCKAYYARFTDRMHGRVVRLLVSPFIKALIAIFGHDPFLTYMNSFRYPLSGEFAVTANLARSNRIPCDWGLEVGMLAEVFRNTSHKRVCQVDLCQPYEHKHQELSLTNVNQGLMRMANDILATIYRTLASRGMVFQEGHFSTLRAAYLRTAQDAIRQYHADALINGLDYNRNAEERAVEGFADRITESGEAFRQDPSGGEAIPNWTRVLTKFPDFPRRLREAVEDDLGEHVTR